MHSLLCNHNKTFWPYCNFHFLDNWSHICSQTFRMLNNCYQKHHLSTIQLISAMLLARKQAFCLLFEIDRKQVNSMAILIPLKSKLLYWFRVQSCQYLSDFSVTSDSTTVPGPEKNQDLFLISMTGLLFL